MTTSHLRTLLDEVRKGLGLPDPNAPLVHPDRPEYDAEVRALMKEKNASLNEIERQAIDQGQRLAVRKACAVRRSPLGRAVFLEAVRKYVGWGLFSKATDEQIARAQLTLYHEGGNEHLLSLVSAAERKFGTKR